MNDKQILTTDDVLPDEGELPEGGNRVEKINGQFIRVGTVDEFVKEIFGLTLKVDDGKKYPVMPGGLILGIEKFKTHAHKWYRLVWVGRGKAWLAAEDVNRFRRHRDTVAAGRAVAEATGAFFLEHSR